MRLKRARLQYHLTLLCVGTTLLTIMLCQVVVSLASSLLAVRSPAMLKEVEDSLQKYEARLVPYFSGAQPDRVGLERWLQREMSTGTLVSAELYPMSSGYDSAELTDTKGRVLTAQAQGTNQVPSLSTMPELREVLAAARRGETKALWSGNRVVAAAPVRINGQIKGYGMLRTDAFSWTALFVRSLKQLLISTLILSGLGSLIVGGVLGQATARWVERRLGRIAEAASAWSAGQLATRAPEQPADEFGQLASHLNHMAQELEQAMAVQSALAVLEERQSVLRELHDTVKQQAFAIAMVVGSARISAQQNDTAGLELALSEAEGLTRQIQSELAGILAQGKSLREGPLTVELERIADDWTRRSGLTVTLRVLCPEPNLPAPQAVQVVRIAEEAITNAVKHSGGTQVLLWLSKETSGYQLKIEDDGVGFAGGAKPTGMGLTTMRERAESLPGGRLELRSAPGQPTQVTLHFIGGQS